MTLIYRVVSFFDESVPDLLQNVIELDIIFRWNLNPSKDLANILGMCGVSGTKATLPKQELLSPAPWFR